MHAKVRRSLTVKLLNSGLLNKDTIDKVINFSKLDIEDDFSSKELTEKLIRRTISFATPSMGFIPQIKVILSKFSGIFVDFSDIFV